jgi:hypothetical protein
VVIEGGTEMSGKHNKALKNRLPLRTYLGGAELCTYAPSRWFAGDAYPGRQRAVLTRWGDAPFRFHYLK